MPKNVGAVHLSNAQVPILKIPMCDEAVNRKNPHEFNFVPSTPGAFTEIYTSKKLRKIFNPSRHSHGPMDRKKRGEDRHLVDQERLRSEQVELVREYGIKQQQFEEMQRDCDDLGTLKKWNRQKREAIRKKVVGAMPNLEAKRILAAEEEVDEFVETQKDGFGRVDAVREAEKRRRIAAKKEELKTKKASKLKKHQKQKELARPKSTAAFIVNKEAVRRKELANAGKTGQASSLQLEKVRK
jgi:hypothetical protein